MNYFIFAGGFLVGVILTWGAFLFVKEKIVKRVILQIKQKESQAMDQSSLAKPRCLDDYIELAKEQTKDWPQWKRDMFRADNLSSLNERALAEIKKDGKPSSETLEKLTEILRRENNNGSK